MLQAWIIIFCARKIFSVGISMPRSPRATMMASLFSKISSKFCSPSWFSTLLMILIARPLGPSTCKKGQQFNRKVAAGYLHVQGLLQTQALCHLLQIDVAVGRRCPSAAWP